MLSKLLANVRIPRLPRAAIYILSVIGCYLALGLCLGMLDFDSPVVAHALQEGAEPDESANTAAALQKQGSVVFRDTPLAEVILILSEQWKVNIVAGSNIDGNVSGTFRHETLEKILDSLLTANGYTYRQIGSSLVVVSRDSFASNPNFTVEVIDIPIQNAEELSELTDALKLKMSDRGQLLPIKASGKFAISDTPENIASVKALLSQIVGSEAGRFTNAPDLSPSHSRGGDGQLDAGAPRVSTYAGAIELRPQFMTAKDLEQPLLMLLGEATIAVVEQENVIVVYGDEVLQQRARTLLQQLDRPRAQVRITGYIYDVDLGEIERLGIDWNAQLMSRAVDANGVPRNLGLSQSGMLTPNAPNNAVGIATGAAQAATTTPGGTATATTAAAANGGQFLFRTLNSNVELQALVQALDQTDGTRLLADPHVTVVDRHTASLGIVTEIPIQQLTQTQQGGSIGTTSFREAGITLEVTPRIAADGTIEMEVSPEFSVLAGFQNGNPIIDTRRATTTVRVTHGQALVIGGLRSKNTVETVKGIPGLMHAKFIGKLFRTHSSEVRESELIVLIMPEIVGYCGGLEREMHALEVTQQQLSKIGTATECPLGPNCNDKYCPNHHPRPRIHNGMEDNGLIGGYDTIFVSPVPPAMVLPDSQYPEPAPEFPSPVNRVEPYPLTQTQFAPSAPSGQFTPPFSTVGYQQPVTQPVSQSPQPQLIEQIPQNSGYPLQAVPQMQMQSMPVPTGIPQTQYPVPTYQQTQSASGMPEVPVNSAFRTASFPEVR